MKQASYSELLEKSRIFATMWADQISAEEPSGLQHSIKEEESGEELNILDEDVIEVGIFYHTFSSLSFLVSTCIVF